MQNVAPAWACWDNACPSGVSYTEHLLSLQICMSQLYFQAGGRGVLLVHPMVASFLSIVAPQNFVNFEWTGKSATSPSGRIGGIQVWAEPAVPANEILVVESKDDLQPLGRLCIVNFVEVPEVLDRLARL